VLRKWQQQLSNLAQVIDHNKAVIFFMDVIEEFRDLSLEEWNFRKIIQEHSANLLEQQTVYCMQRGRIKWTTLGEENTRFLHANATIRHNKNAIMVLKHKDGLEKTSHEDKAAIIWEAFKERMGSSEFTYIYYDLADLVQPVDNLEDLTIPFSKEEIDTTVKKLQSGKSPDSNGFNSDFIKKCWGVVSADFYELCHGFYHHKIYLQSINNSFYCTHS
jgi:hypothetical protein